MIETRLKYGYDNNGEKYSWERVFLINDDTKEIMAIYEPCTNIFWLALYEDKNYRGKVITKQKKYREKVADFLKSEMAKNGYMYLDWLKPEEQKNHTGNFWQDWVNNIV